MSQGQMPANMGNSQMYQMNQMNMMQSGTFGNQINRGPAPQNTRFQSKIIFDNKSFRQIRKF